MSRHLCKKICLYDISKINRRDTSHLTPVSEFKTPQIKDGSQYYLEQCVNNKKNILSGLILGEGELHRVSLSKNEGAGSLISGQAETGQQLLGNSIETNEQYGIGKPPQSLDISGTVKPTEKLPTNTSVNIASSSSQVAGQSSNSSYLSLPPTNLNQGENLPMKQGNASSEKEPSFVQPNNAVTMTPKPSQITTLSDTFVEMNNRNLSDTGNMNSVSNFQTPIPVGADGSLSDISTSRPLPRPQGTVAPGQGYNELPTFQKQSTAMPDHTDNSNFQDKLPESNVIPGNEDETEEKYEDLKPLYRYTSSPASVQSDSEDLVDQEEGEEGFKNENEKATLAPPYIKEDLITHRTFNLDERIDEEIGLMTFYSWILFIVFVMISMCVFFRHRHAVRAYWSRSRGTKYHSNLSQVEEGKSLMKNMYA
ncbi:hypothetical protein FSP39_003956 [Pinctada imbricata]|uniref:Uncharacterized protein n=1 Tax=Pinctada imbricata TaxID=66713 RepID=A0AA88XPM9_PINIB|nr:hypothetical protein FSP39_003956 [Pinctada imbricata]